jgi:hypothetical protein
MAAAATYRLDSTQSSARDWVHAFPWSTWDDELPWSVSPGTRWLTAAAWHYLSTAARDATVEATIREAVRQAIVARAFDERGAYGGMYGDSTNGWDWSWGSNAAQGMYGSNLAIADQFGIRDGRASAELLDLAQTYLHYLLGRNPLNMLYMTNMAHYGGEHSSFQIYHSWFSHTGEDGDHGNDDYNGKPIGVTEPLYPYYSEDTQTSVNGPAPGIVPGGPNWSYSGTYEIPNRTYPAYAYRDWSVGCDWDGSACLSSSWEVTENDTRYQGPLVLLVSFFMSPHAPSSPDGGPQEDGATPSDGGDPNGAGDASAGGDPTAGDDAMEGDASVGGDPTAGDGAMEGDDSAGGDPTAGDGAMADDDTPARVLFVGCGCRSAPVGWVWLLAGWLALRGRATQRNKSASA